MPKSVKIQRDNRLGTFFNLLSDVVGLVMIYSVNRIRVSDAEKWRIEYNRGHGMEWDDFTPDELRNEIIRKLSSRDDSALIELVNEIYDDYLTKIEIDKINEDGTVDGPLVNHKKELSSEEKRMLVELIRFRDHTYSVLNKLISEYNRSRGSNYFDLRQFMKDYKSCVDSYRGSEDKLFEFKCSKGLPTRTRYYNYQIIK